MADLKPTDEMRRRVTISAGGGMSHEDIAAGLGFTVGELERAFEVELSRGAIQRRMEALEAIHAAAVKGNVTAARTYLERAPTLGLPPLPDAPEAEAKGRLGKKEQAARDAVTAAKGTAWDDLLPKGSGAPLQ